MPELPEVETIARKLQALIPGKVIKDVIQYHPKSFVGDKSKLNGLPIVNITRRAKIIRISFTNQLNLLIHLKMTGQLIYVDDNHRVGGGHPTADWVAQLPSKHTRVELVFNDGGRLFFNDQRLFGWLRLQTDQEVEKAFEVLAPDIIDPAITPGFLAEKFKRRGQTVKQLIMDTAIVSGVGNIYACDALNLARISPHRPAKTLTLEEIERLVTATKQVITQGIELGGTTFDGKYVDIDGLAGQYQSVVRVYGREGKECLYCQGEITKTTLGGRGTYYCVQCQV